MRFYHRLLVTATLLAFAVIALGAYVRLSDAGLGCPDWPGCYGHWLGIPDQAHEQLAAGRDFPLQPVDTTKAWKEMIHRYFAATLGLLILGLCLFSWCGNIRKQYSPLLPTLLLGVVGLQAALGMWTVTLQLKPVIVALHLIGGMTTLALLLSLMLRNEIPVSQVPQSLRRAAMIALLVVIIQIALGGWVSSNYAALACPDFPLCQGKWLPAMDFREAFSVHRELGLASDGRPLSLEALTAIHWIHRLGATAVTLSIAILAFGLRKTGQPRWKSWTIVLLLMLTIQICLGVANILLSLPLQVAVAHNLGAAGLLSVLVTLNIQLQQASRRLNTQASSTVRGAITQQ